eukprot:4147511-Prymnesium_polylepis.1
MASAASHTTSPPPLANSSAVDAGSPCATANSTPAFARCTRRLARVFAPPAYQPRSSSSSSSSI